LGVSINSKYAVRSIVEVFQLLALYLSFALLPFMPVPLPIPETVRFGSTICPVVYGFDVLGLVPVIGLVKIDWPCPIIRKNKNRVNK